MTLAAIMVVAAATTFVPPNRPVIDHSQPYHSAQPTVRRFEDRPTDDLRRANYEAYVAEIDRLWQVYRLDGSTPQGFREYQFEAAQAKTRYIYADPWFVPIHDDVYYRMEQPRR